MLEALYPRSHGVSVETANRRLDSVSDIKVTVHHDHDDVGPVPQKVVKWADLEHSHNESPEVTASTAGPVISHADGRPGNASRVRGRREGLVSTTPSRDASSAEHLGELRDPDFVVRVPSPTSLSVVRVPSPTPRDAVRVPSPALPQVGESSQPSGGARSPARRLFCVGRKRPVKDDAECDELRGEPQSVSLLKQQPLVSRMAAERRCKDITAISTIMQTSYDHDQYLRHTHESESDTHSDNEQSTDISYQSTHCVSSHFAKSLFHKCTEVGSNTRHSEDKHMTECSFASRIGYSPLPFYAEHCEPLP